MHMIKMGCKLVRADMFMLSLKMWARGCECAFLKRADCACVSASVFTLASFFTACEPIHSLFYTMISNVSVYSSWLCIDWTGWRWLQPIGRVQKVSVSNNWQNRTSDELFRDFPQWLHLHLFILILTSHLMQSAAL